MLISAFTAEAERRGTTLLVSFSGDLDMAAAPVMHAALADRPGAALTGPIAGLVTGATTDLGGSGVITDAADGITVTVTVLMVDLHRVPFMDTSGLLLLLDLHRRAECLGLRVLVVGWQTQPAKLMAGAAGIPAPGPATGGRYAVTGFRRLIEERGERARAAALGASLA
ncbi:STAS domain-containing protein [Streptomyces sp. NPDC006529]|uniref:STAS domain-containing protein n=1 Tax=Streptomyces sp. NPDC006529 TaxID=3157177 RepID=UPI0033A0F966